jgi:hypothetical protein
MLQFERSEVALTHLNRRLAQFRLDAAAGRAGGRLIIDSRPIVRSSVGALDTLRVRHEDALARFMSIADEFTAGLLVEVTERVIPSERRVSVMWDRYVDKETDTWDQRFGSWESLHEVRVAAFPAYDAFRGYVEARNALIHGLGALTRKQLKNPKKVLGRLSSAKVRTVGNRLELATENVLGCATVVSEFVRWLDREGADAAARP